MTSPAPDMTDPAFVAALADGLADVREHAPLVAGKAFDGTPAWFVTRQDDVRAVLADPRFVNSPDTVPGGAAAANRDGVLEMLGVPRRLFPYMTRSILDVDGADHVRLRKLVSRAFTVRRVDGLRPRVEQITAGLLDGLGPTTDLVAEFAYPLPITVI